MRFTQLATILLSASIASSSFGYESPGIQINESATGFTTNSTAAEMLYSETRQSYMLHVKGVSCSNSKEKNCLGNSLTLIGMSRSKEESEILRAYWKIQTELAGKNVEDCMSWFKTSPMNTDKEMKTTAKQICRACRKDLLRYVESLLSHRSYGMFANIIAKQLPDEVLERVVLRELKFKKQFDPSYIPR